VPILTSKCGVKKKSRKSLAEKRITGTGGEASENAKVGA